MFKLITMSLLFFTSTLIGFYQSAQLSRRYKLLLQYRDFLNRLETEMGYFKAPLPQILQKLHRNDNKPIDILLRQCLVQLETSTESLEQIWGNALISAYEGEPLNKADLALFKKCSTFLGQSNYQGQKGHFALLNKELDCRIDEMHHICRTKGPLYSKAGLSIGAVLAIALL